MKIPAILSVWVLFNSCMKSNLSLPPAADTDASLTIPSGVHIVVDSVVKQWYPEDVTGGIDNYPEEYRYDIRYASRDRNLLTLVASDSASSFTLHVEMEDLSPGKYLLDTVQRFYNYSFMDYGQRQTIRLPYSGFAYYTDSLGTFYIKQAQVDFFQLSDNGVVGKIQMTSMINAATNQVRSFAASFNKRL